MRSQSSDRIDVLLISDTDTWNKDIAYASRNSINFPLANYALGKLALSNMATFTGGEIGQDNMVHFGLPFSYILAGQSARAFLLLGSREWDDDAHLDLIRQLV